MPRSNPLTLTRLGICLGAFLALSACRPAEYVHKQEARVAVVAMGQAVNDARDTCVSWSRMKPDAEAAVLLRKCSVSYQAARAALLDASVAVDNWYEAGAPGRFGCSMAHAVATLEAEVPLLPSLLIPQSVFDGMEWGHWAVRTYGSEGAVCKA